MFKGQIFQDRFVLSMLNYKNNGYFIEIGSNDPIRHNNTYILENNFNWKGIMIEYDKKWYELYKNIRTNSIHIMEDATKIDYKTLFETNQMPLNIDYLQIDLEVDNNSTMETLIKFDNEIFDKYKFAVITFEHDVYRDPTKETIKQSREIFLKRGYYMVLNNVSDSYNPFEDWYVHPELVDMNIVKLFQNNNLKNYKNNNITQIAIEYTDIEY